MKKILILIGVALLISGCLSKMEIKDIEAYCVSFGQVCSQDSQDKNLCEICPITQSRSYASCHSKKFCKNIPFE